MWHPSKKFAVFITLDDVNISKHRAVMRKILGGAGNYVSGTYEEEVSEVNMTLFFIGEPRFQDSSWPEYASAAKPGVHAFDYEEHRAWCYACEESAQPPQPTPF